MDLEKLIGRKIRCEDRTDFDYFVPRKLFKSKSHKYVFKGCIFYKDGISSPGCTLFAEVQGVTLTPRVWKLVESPTTSFILED